MVSSEGLSIDHNKLVNINDWPTPKTGKQIQHILGVFNYFREHVPVMSSLTSSLDNLRNIHNVEKVWNDKHEKTFQAIKSLLPKLPPLSHPNFDKKFYVATDASNVGIGAVLYQGDEEPIKKYISFQARSLQPAERNYSANKKELLAIIFALNKFHYYLWGTKFTLFTDHRSLIYLHTQKSLNSMMQFWQDTLFNYDFEVCHRPGILNILPDHLSRIFPTFSWEGNGVPNDTNSNISVKLSAVMQNMENNFTIPNINEQHKILQEKHLLGHFGSDSIVNAVI